MKKNVIALIAGAAALCIMAAGCGSQQQDNTAATAGTTQAAAAATTAAAAEEAEPSWKDMDTSYLSGITASDYVELPENYKHQSVEVAKPDDPTDEQVEERIQAVLQSNGALVEVDRAVEKGDTVSIDYVGKIDGEEFEGGTGSYDLLIGSGAFIEGFEEGLIGAEKDETRDLNLKFPDDYPAEDVAGKDVVFTVTVNKISEYVLSDDFVKSLNLTNAFGQAVTDVDSFREYIRSNMIEENESTYTWLIKHEIDNNLLETVTFKQDIPENMLESYYFQYQNYLSNAASSNYMDLATFMQKQYGATEDNYDSMIHDFAKQAAQLGLIYQAIADERELNPTEEEVRTAISEYVKTDTTGATVENLDRYIQEYVRDELLSNRVRDWLYEYAEVSEPEEGEEDSADTSASSETAEEDNGGDSADTSEAASTEEEAAEEGATEETAAQNEN